MALLDDIFGPGTLQIGPNGEVVNLADPEMLRRLFGDAGTFSPGTALAQPPAGTITTGDIVSRMNAPAPAPMTTENIAPGPRPGVPYAAPTETPAAAPATPARTVGAPAELGLGDRFRQFFQALQGGDPRAVETENLTVRALMRRGLDEATARAAARVPALIPTLLGPRASDWTFTAQAGVDKYGNHIPGFVNARTQEIRLLGANQPGQQPGGGTARDTTGLTGQALLDALDPGDRAQVQAILEGRQAPPSPNARNQRTQRIMEWVAQADPTFDMTNYQARNATNREFAANRPGTAGGAITALETAMGHLERLSRNADALGNNSYPGGQLFRQYVENPIARNATGLSDFSARENNFNIVRKAALDEAARVFAGTGTGVFDRKAWEEKLTASQDPVTLQQGIRELVALMKSRIDSLAGSYNRTMGTDRDAYSFMKPATAALMQRFLGEGGEEAPGAGATTPPTREQPSPTTGSPSAVPPRPSSVPSGSMYSPSRQQWRDSDGRLYDATGKRLGTQ